MVSWIRLLYALLIPVAGLGVLLAGGWKVHLYLGLPLVIGVFVYHILQLCLFKSRHPGANQKEKQGWILTLFTIVIVGILVRGTWINWIVEQFLLQVVGFLGGIAAITIHKLLAEGKSAPWALAIIVLILPVVAALCAIFPFWISQHPDPNNWVWCLFTLGFLLSVRASYLELKPYCVGNQVMDDALNSSKILVVVVVWLLILLGIALWMNASSTGSN